MTSSNHDDHDWLDPFFLYSLFLSLGIVVSESRETLALMKAFGYTDVNAKVISISLSFLGLSRICSWDSLSVAIMEILIGVIKIQFLKVEHHFDGNVCFWTLIGFCCGL